MNHLIESLTNQTNKLSIPSHTYPYLSIPIHTYIHTFGQWKSSIQHPNQRGVPPTSPMLGISSGMKGFRTVSSSMLWGLYLAIGIWYCVRLDIICASVIAYVYIWYPMENWIDMIQHRYNYRYCMISFLPNLFLACPKVKGNLKNSFGEWCHNITNTLHQKVFKMPTIPNKLISGFKHYLCFVVS